MKLIPYEAKSKIAKVFQVISRSTYHILLTQILYFGIVVALYGDHYRASIFGINTSEDLVLVLYLIMNWIICIPIGIAWWYAEMKFIVSVRKYFKTRREK
jgi:hypothetical protein